ncbi:MAG TPA: hypothetical protein VJJ98_03360 [Sedimentisphaerales bacterium]|nr:hypothetical protein [Sedimentisphaerales bacterium]
MRRKNTLTKKQLDVIEDLFAGELDEQAVLEKHNVNARLYNKWQGEDAFIELLEKRIVAAHRQSAAMLARYAPIAAAKLVQLTQSEKEETARKACLDIIAMQPSPTPAPKPQHPEPNTPDQPQSLTPQTAAKILAILAEENQEPDEKS